MIGVPEAVACDPILEPRDALILQLQARIAELENPAPPKAAEQTTDGGAIRNFVFPPEGEHPEGGPQPALTSAAEAEAPVPAKPPEKAGKPGRAA